MPSLVPVRRALVSVSDKSGLLPFVQALVAHGVEIISTGGTADMLRKAGVKVTTIDSVTGFPEILGGRVKTLHPKVHGGLLGLRDDPHHLQQMAQHAIDPIDLVCVNLYPFEQTIARPDCTRDEAIEHIDIGGPSMIRSAAKNHAFVTVVTSPAQYSRVQAELQTHHGATTSSLREALAHEAFVTTCRYDAAIATYLSRSPDTLFPPLLHPSFVRAEELRHGENAHQRAALYRAGTPGPEPSVAFAEQLHGKELSYNNLSDGAAALSLAVNLSRIDPARTGACVIKHTNPCGAALALAPADAVDMAIAGDPMAAYGGILAINQTIDARAAERICHKDNFFEVIIAPAFESGALAMLQKRWINVRLLGVGSFLPREERTDEHGAPLDPSRRAQVELRSIPGGLLVQERDLLMSPPHAFTHAAGPAPTPEQIDAARFLEVVGRALFSNAVVLGGSAPGAAGPGLRVFGAGAGQMDRLTSCRLCVEKAGRAVRGAIAYSDAFFPFPDGPEVLIDAGVTCIVHPGGAKRDAETFSLCAARGVTCLTTGTRHFRH